MNTPAMSRFPERMNSYMTTEHFTLQAGRSIINSEIASRVAMYFTTLSGVIIAAAFVAQIPEMSQVFIIFGLFAFPLLILLGFFTASRLAVLAAMDAQYIRAINRIRHFYFESTPEIGLFLLFPPYDDQRSIAAYGGWSSTSLIRDNLLSAANMIVTANSIVITILVAVLSIEYYDLPFQNYLPGGIVVFLVAYFLHMGVAFLFVRPLMHTEEYSEIRFPRSDARDDPTLEAGEEEG